MAEIAIRPKPAEKIVASVHGNGVFSDFEKPVAIRHSAEGALLAPASKSQLEGLVHYILPTLPAPENLGLAGGRPPPQPTITQLYIAASSLIEKEPTSSEITLVEIYAGKDRIWKSEALDKKSDFYVNVSGLLQGVAGIYNENPKGLGVTLTIKFVGGGNDLLISSVALIQSYGVLGKRLEASEETGE